MKEACLFLVIMLSCVSCKKVEQAYSPDIFVFQIHHATKQWRKIKIKHLSHIENLLKNEFGELETSVLPLGRDMEIKKWNFDNFELSTIYRLVDLEVLSSSVYFRYGYTPKHYPIYSTHKNAKGRTDIIPYKRNGKIEWDKRILDVIKKDYPKDLSTFKFEADPSLFVDWRIK